jgi:hypothetical protein
MQKIAFGLRVRALFWGREKRGALLTPNATLRKSMCIDWEWDAIFSRLQKGVYRWGGFIGWEKRCVLTESERYFERCGKVVVWYESESRKKKSTQTTREWEQYLKRNFWKNLQQQRSHLRAWCRLWGETQISKRSRRSTSTRRYEAGAVVPTIIYIKTI